MDNYERELLEQAIDILSRIIGYADARADSKPVFRFVDDSRETLTTAPPYEQTGVVLQFPTTFRAAAVEETEQGAAECSQKEVCSIFSDEEISKMPRKFRKIFRTNKQTAHVRKKDGDVYEIRMQINGHRITASAKYLDLAKERFIKKLRKYNEQGAEVKKEQAQIAPAFLSYTVSEYALHYLDTFKRPNVSEKHFSNLCGIVRRHIARFFGKTLMKDITATDCQKLLNELTEQGKGRTVEELESILSWICSAAVADRILPADVMTQIQTIPHKRIPGKVIPREYIRAFLSQQPTTRAEFCLYFLVYTGARPCELSSLIFDDKGFVSIKTAKKKKWETEEIRRIPLHPNLLPYVEKIREALPITLVVLEKAFRRHFPSDYRLYDLRHTFSTIAQQAHCYKPWVDYVTAHKENSNTTDRVYTHWEDEWQQKEIEKIEF